MIESIFEAIRSGAWKHVVGLLALVIVAGVKHYGLLAKVPDRLKWLVPALVAGVLSVASGLLADLDWLTIVQMAVTAGLEASGAHAWIKQAKPGAGVLAATLALTLAGCSGAQPPPVTQDQAVHVADYADRVAHALLSDPEQLREVEPALATLGREATSKTPDTAEMASALGDLLDVLEPIAAELGDDIPDSYRDALLALRLLLVRLSQ